MTRTLAHLVAAFLLVLSPLAAEGTRTFTILHTNDIQSRLLGFGPNAEYSPETLNDDDTIGGFARLATMIERRRAAARAEGRTLLLLDGGDFTMGTLFHTVTRQTGGELQLMSMVGYDAAVLGNHEFDYRADGLGRMIKSALAKAKNKLPALLLANVKYSETDPGDDALEELTREGVIQPYTVIERGGIKFGILGILGNAAWKVTARKEPLTHLDPFKTAAETARILREKEKVDVVIVCSHSGVMTPRAGDDWEGEDVRLGGTPGIDIVVGGHSHTPIEDPRMVDDRVPVLQAGSEARFLGELTMELSDEGPKFISYKLIPIDDATPGDRAATAKIDELKGIVTREILAPRGFRFDQPLAVTPRTLTEKHDDPVLGFVAAESIRRATRSDVGFSSNGVIRDEVTRGRTGVQSVSDVFRIAPLGLGEDDVAGDSLVKLYFTGRELKNILEILSFAYRTKGESYYPRFAGLRYHLNPWRMPLDAVFKVELNGEGGYREIELDDKKLYSVGTTKYLAGFLGLIEEMSHGLLKVNPKTVDGEPVTDILTARIDADPERPGIQELKEWVALFRFVREFPNGSGTLPEFPTTGEFALDRAVTTRGVGTLFYNAGYTWLYLPLLVVLLGAGFLARRKLRSN